MVNEHYENELKRKRCSTENYSDEILEEIWVNFENEGREAAPGVEIDPSLLSNYSLDELLKSGYLKKENEAYYLTEEGYERAKQLIRSHRLAERLLTDVLNFNEDEVEKTACHYEHILTDEAIDSVCTLLGHPRSCPHGKKIPPGRCCVEGAVKFRPLVVSLTQVEPGEEAVVEYIGTKDNARLAYLTSFGFVPGRTIKLIRKRPAFVILLEETVVSIDEELAKEIFVRPRRTKVRRQERKRWGLRWLKG